MTSASAKDLAERLRERTALKYMGNCKCGRCQLVARDDVVDAAALLTRYAEVEEELETTGEERRRLAFDADHMARLGHEYAGWLAEMFQRLHRDLARLIAQVAALKEERDALVKERDWLIECNGRSAVRAERAEDNEQTSLRLRDQAQADAAIFLAERNAANARAERLAGALREAITLWDAEWQIWANGARALLTALKGDDNV